MATWTAAVRHQHLRGWRGTRSRSRQPYTMGGCSCGARLSQLRCGSSLRASSGRVGALPVSLARCNTHFTGPRCGHHCGPFSMGRTDCTPHRDGGPTVLPDRARAAWGSSRHSGLCGPHRWTRTGGSWTCCDATRHREPFPRSCAISHVPPDRSRSAQPMGTRFQQRRRRTVIYR